MAVLESYSPCPCGSGQKYKWCCQKAESFAQKSARLQESGALEPAKAALDEGLAKFPENPWLSLRKAVLLARLQKMPEAAGVLRKLVAKEPSHVGAQGLLLRLILETEGTSSAIEQLQRALSSVDSEIVAGLAPSVQAIGLMLAEEEKTQAAIAHLELADAIADENQELPVARPLTSILADPSTSPWLRNHYDLTTAPENLPSDKAAAFADAMTWAESGLWSSAAAGFELLAGQGVIEASRNAGLCRLWLGEHGSAVQLLRRYIVQKGVPQETVDLEALCQVIEPSKPSDLVGRLQLIWTCRDREGLLKKLRAEPSVSDEGVGHLDETDPNSPEVQAFLLLDRPMTEDKTVGASQLPRIEGRVLVGLEIVALELIDDGRLERLRDRLTELAGTCLPPAHPRTKSLGPVSRVKLALDSEIRVPAGLDRNQLRAIRTEEQERIFTTVWPDTPMPALGGRTPRKAAKDGDAEVPLRAMLVQYEFLMDTGVRNEKLAELRRTLNLPEEPEVDPETLQPESLHISKLNRVAVERLTDVGLTTVYVLAREYLLPVALEKAIREIIRRPEIFERDQLDPLLPYSDLANLELSRGVSKDDVLAIVAEGRRADKLKASSLRWDFLELRLRARVEPPQEWVPKLAVILESNPQDESNASLVMLNLYEMGLIELTPNREEPGRMVIDTRRLQAVLTQFGPKITTASGRLGVSATQGSAVWTPGKETSGPSGIWTPGSAAQTPASGDKPKLIIPGR